MFDARLRRLIDQPLNAAGQRLAARGIRADQVTISGCAISLVGALAAALGFFLTALVLLLIGRLSDGLDGAVARASRPTDRGGFLDIALDFIVYAAYPVAFACHDPVQNGLAAALLLAAFLINGTSFLAFATLAAKRGLETTAQGRKSIYYLAGLAEGGETILAFSLFCLFPKAFAWIAYGFAALCVLSGLARIVVAAQRLHDGRE